MCYSPPRWREAPSPQRRAVSTGAPHHGTWSRASGFAGETWATGAALKSRKASPDREVAPGGRSSSVASRQWQDREVLPGPRSFTTRCAPEDCSFTQAWSESPEGASPAAEPSRDVDWLGGVRYLACPALPTRQHEERLLQCVRADRYTEYFNVWMGKADYDSCPAFRDASECTLFQAFHIKLCSLDVPLANTPTEDTASLPVKCQEWVLLNRVKDILRTGALCVGCSNGFTQQSAYLHIGCPECGVAHPN